MEFIRTIVNPNYWIAHQTPVSDAWVYGLAALFGVLVLIGLVCSVLASIKKFKKPYRNFYFRLAVWGWVMGLYGFVTLFFSMEQIWILSSRSFYLLWFIVGVWWLYYVILYRVQDVPRLIASAKERVEREKYLPKRKK